MSGPFQFWYFRQFKIYIKPGLWHLNPKQQQQLLSSTKNLWNESFRTWNAFKWRNFRKFFSTKSFWLTLTRIHCSKTRRDNSLQVKAISMTLLLSLSSSLQTILYILHLKWRIFAYMCLWCNVSVCSCLFLTIPSTGYHLSCQPERLKSLPTTWQHLMPQWFKNGPLPVSFLFFFALSNLNFCTTKKFYFRGIRTGIVVDSGHQPLMNMC